MISRDEALKTQKVRSRNCIIVSIVSVLLLTAAVVLLSLFVANNLGEIWFYVVLAVIIEFFVLKIIRFEQFFEPKEVRVRVIKNEAVTVTQRQFQGANGPATTYAQDVINKIQMTLVDEKGVEFIRRFPYRSELGTIKPGDDLSLLNFIYEPVVVTLASKAN